MEEVINFIYIKKRSFISLLSVIIHPLLKHDFSPKVQHYKICFLLVSLIRVLIIIRPPYLPYSLRRISECGFIE